MFSFPIESDLPAAIKEAFLGDFKKDRNSEHYRHMPKDDNDETVPSMSLP